MKVCPSCSATNPNENKFCGQCGSRLPTSPATSVPGQFASGAPSTAAEVPARPQPNDETQRTVQPEPTSDLPDWLRDLDASVQPVGTGKTSAPSGDLPDWLRALSEPEDKQPTASEPVTNTSRDLPPWLLEDVPNETLARSDTAAASVTQEAPSSTDLPPWLREERPVPAATASGASTIDDTLPPRLVDEHSAIETLLDQPATATGQARDTFVLPAWLVDEEPTASTATEGSTTFGPPSWLIKDMPEASERAHAEASTPTTQEIPSWLLEDVPVPVDASHAEASTPTTQEIPSWLLEDAPLAPASTAKRSDEGLPLWLLEDDTTHTTASPGGASIYETPVQPGNTGNASPLEQQTSPRPAANNDLPPWLMDMGTKRADPVQAESALPPWLQEPEPPTDENQPPA